MTDKSTKIRRKDLKTIPLNKISPDTDELTVVIVGAVDSSKCFGLGTKVMMIDGSTKKVEDLELNNKLMGDDFKARTIRELHYGIGRLYKIIPKKGQEYRVNGRHILVLKDLDGSIIEISVNDFMGLENEDQQSLKWYRMGGNTRETTIRIVDDNIGKYIGFVLDGNKRFLLEDYSVSHNSTILGVLSNHLLREDPTNNIKKCLDDGDGKARELITSLPHEKTSGRTSSISYTPILLDKQYWPYLNANRAVMISDLCGHDRYLKTTVTGVCGSYCDYAFVCIDRIKNHLNPMTCEHIKILLALNIPFAIIISKIDLYSEIELKDTIKKINKYIKQYKKTIIIKNNEDLDIKINYDTYVPFFLISCKTGYGLLRIMEFLTRIPLRKVKLPSLYIIDSIFTVKGYSTVVSGYSGIDIKIGDRLMLGPFQTNIIKNIFCEVSIRSIHDNYHNYIPELKAGRRGCLCTKLNQKDIQYRNKLKAGMVLCNQIDSNRLTVDNKSSSKLACNFRAEINIFNGHHTTITTGFIALCNIGTVRASAKFILGDKWDVKSEARCESGRSGDRIKVELEFKTPICVMIGSEFIFREGISVGHGHILEAIN